jgi:dimethylglycine dehydrogenase
MEATGVRSTCVTVLVDGPDDADPWGREALYAADGSRTGRLTSGGYSVQFGKSIGLGYVRPEHAAPGTRLEVRMQGRRWPAEVVRDSPYDPDNVRLRADIAAPAPSPVTA